MDTFSFSWPAILCSDIIEGNYASFDEDEDLKHYHVEYFGRPRSHSWVLARNVEIYVSGNAPPPYFLAKSKGMASAKAKESFEIAVHEADKLLLLKPIERLKNCIFKPISKGNDICKLFSPLLFPLGWFFCPTSSGLTYLKGIEAEAQ